MNDDANSSTHSSATSASDDEVRIPLLEETAHVDKHAIEKGSVRISMQTETRQETLHETLRSDAVGVARVSIERTLAEGESLPQIREEDGVTIIPVFEERLVVEKHLVLVEELRIRQTTQGKEVELPVTLRKQHASVTRSSTETQSSLDRTVPPEDVER